MSGAIHLIAALVVIFGIPGLLVILEYRIRPELFLLGRMVAQLRIANPGNAVVAPVKADPKPEPRPDPRITAAEGRIAFLESEREFYAKKWEAYDEMLQKLRLENERLESEIQKSLQQFPIHVIDAPQNRLTMWRSE